VTGELDTAEQRQLGQKARRAALEALVALGGAGRREEVLEEALARGGFTPRELAAPCAPSGGGSYARAVDHELSWALTHLKRDGRVENPRRGIWRLPTAADPPLPGAAAAPPGETRLAELRAMPYPRYLRSPEWRRTRASALERAGHCCSLDVTHTDGLEVHHRTYERLGSELASDLIVLCHPCHQLHHQMYGPARSPVPSPDPSPAPAEPAAHSPDPKRKSWLRRLLAG
jgi:hypothetical protein